MGFKFTSGSIFQGLAMIGGGILGLHEGVPIIGWGLIVIGCLALFFDIHIERGKIQVGTPLPLGQRIKKMWPQMLMLVCFIGFLIGLVAFLQKDASSVRLSSTENPKQPPSQQPQTAPETPIPPNLLAPLLPLDRLRPATPAPVAPTSATPPNPKERSRLVVTRFGFSQDGTEEKGRSVRVYFRNRGSIPGVGPAVTAAFDMPDDLKSSDDVTKTLDLVKSNAFSPKIFERDRPLVETDQEYWKAAGFSVTAADYAAITAGTKAFYLFFAMTYTDSELPKSHFWLTEYVGLMKGPSTDITIVRSNTEMMEVPKGAPPAPQSPQDTEGSTQQ